MAGGKEELHTFDLSREVGFNSCLSISDISCDANTPRSHCSRGSSGVQTKRSSQAGWTEQEDTMLADLVRKYNGRNWKKIAESIPGRSDVQCLHRWQKVLNPELVKGPWTKQEDDHIRELVEKHGCKKWSLIAKHLAGRIGKQCRERWHNHLDPAIKKDAWTEEEDSTLAYNHQIYGNRWAEIARFLPGRTDNAIKNHWNSSKRRLDLNASPEFSLAKKRNRGILFTEHKTEEKKTSTSPDAPMSSVTMFETPKKRKVDSVNNLKLLTSPVNSSLSLLTFGLNDPNSQTRTDESSKQINGQFSCSTPPALSLSISLNSSPELILRNSAMSYKNTPSIIRKKAAKKDDDLSTPSLGRRLECVFDAEWDLTMVRCCTTPGSVTPSSKTKMLTP